MIVDEHCGLYYFGCFHATTETVEAPAAPAAPTEPPKEEKKPDEKESPEDIKKRARKPPAEGPCKGCGKNLPLNRLMLCYRCWVNKNLTDADKDFIPGIDPHPKTCQCDLPEHGGARTQNN